MFLCLYSLKRYPHNTQNTQKPRKNTFFQGSPQKPKTPHLPPKTPLPPPRSPLREISRLGGERDLEEEERRREPFLSCWCLAQNSANRPVTRGVQKRDALNRFWGRFSHVQVGVIAFWLVRERRNARGSLGVWNVQEDLGVRSRW